MSFSAVLPALGLSSSSSPHPAAANATTSATDARTVRRSRWGFGVFTADLLAAKPGSVDPLGDRLDQRARAADRISSVYERLGQEGVSASGRDTARRTTAGRVSCGPTAGRPRHTKGEPPPRWPRARA